MHRADGAARENGQALIDPITAGTSGVPFRCAAEAFDSPRFDRTRVRTRPKPNDLQAHSTRDAAKRGRVCSRFTAPRVSIAMVAPHVSPRDSGARDMPAAVAGGCGDEPNDRRAAAQAVQQAPANFYSRALRIK